MRFKIDWASLIVGRKFDVFALLYFVFEGNFRVEAPGGGGAYICRGDLTEGFCVKSLGCLYLEGLLHGGAYFRNFTVFSPKLGLKSNVTFWGLWFWLCINTNTKKHLLLALHRGT